MPSPFAKASVRAFSVYILVHAGKELASWQSSVLCFLVFCHFSKCVLVHIGIKREVGAVKLV